MPILITKFGLASRDQPILITKMFILLIPRSQKNEHSRIMPPYKTKTSILNKVLPFFR